MQKFPDDNIKLIESTHQYRLADDPEFEFTSCTTFAKYFFEPFDKIGVANRLTSSHPKYIDFTPQELVMQWDEIAAEGTLVHAEVENFIKHEQSPTHPKGELAAEWLNENLLGKERYDIYSEVIVFSKEIALAGTIDLLIHDRETGTYKLLDWKTNKRIETKSFNNKMGHHPATRHLMDCNYYHYSIQLSLYRYILEKYYGLTINGSAIAHLTGSGVQFYKTDYNKDEVEIMLNADRDALKRKTEESLTLEFVNE